MNFYLSMVTLFILAVLQSTVAPRIVVLGVHPDLLLVAVTSWSLLRGSYEGMIWAVIGGLMVDLFSGMPFGVGTLALLVVAFGSGLGNQNIFRFDLFVPFLVVPLATLVYYVLVLALLTVLGRRPDWQASMGRVVLPSMLLNTLLTPILYVGARLLHRLTRRKEIKL